MRPTWKYVLPAALAAASLAAASEDDWPSYNRTLTSERFAPHAQITRTNVGKLHPICTYDTGIVTGFQTGPIVVEGVLYGTTEKDTFAIDASSCGELWRVHEDVESAALPVNRGVAYYRGRVYRGLQDGRVVAYDARTGERIWSQHVANPRSGESVPAAPIAWSGLVFIGNGGGDNYGVKGRMYALDAETGRIRWQFYLVPRRHPQTLDDEASQMLPTHEFEAMRTWGNEPDVPVAGGATWTSYTLDPNTGQLYVPGGSPAPDFLPDLRRGRTLYANSVVVLDARHGRYRAHFTPVPRDFHDWDVAAAPVVTTTHSKQRRMYVAPKDGHLYGYDLENGERLFRTPVTTIENADAPLTEDGTRFCPGTQGGSGWNGPAYDPLTNLVYTGAVDWCTTVRVAPAETVKRASYGQPWTGSADESNPFGRMDAQEHWRGWLTATDADSGEVRWRFETPAPILSGITPTAGGVVFFGDIDGTLYALDTRSGQPLWSTQLDGAAGGGVISYVTDGEQRIAVAAGSISPNWPGPRTTGRIVVFGLE